MLGGPSLRLGILIERLSIPPAIGWGGNDTGRLATWDCPLRTDSASWKSLESFIQLISFCNSCNLPVNSKIVSESSTNLRLATVSKVELWNFFNSSISLRLLWWASRNSEICCKNCSWRSCWSHRCFLSAMKFFLLRFNNFTQCSYTSSVIISLKFVFLNFRLAFGEDLLFLSVQQSSNLCVSNV